MRKVYIILIFLLCSCVAASAQISGAKTVRMDSTIMKLNSMTLEDYRAIVLPSLDSMYYNALSMSNAIKYFESEQEYYRREVLTQKRKPLDWIRIIGTYSYGNTDMAAITLMETTYQIWSQNTTSQRNMYYNIGASLIIPLGEIFNTRNKVKQAKAQAEQFEYKKQETLDGLKERIIDLYCTIIEQTNLLESASKQMVVAQAQYSLAEADFINGKCTSEELYRSQSYASGSVQTYENIKKALNTAILTLEVISCTPIISK